MKIAHLMMLPALLLAGIGSTHAQMPGHPTSGMVPPGNSFPGQTVNFADPMPMAPGGAMGAMNSSPMYPEAMSGADGGFVGQDCFGRCGPAFGRYNARCGYGYIQVDALYWEREHGWGVPIFQPNSAPTSTYLTGANLNYEFEVLPRLTGGYVLGNGVAIEGSYFYKDDFSVRTGLGVAGDVDMTAFGTPAAGSSYDNANWGGINASTKLQSGEINLVETERFFNFLLGFRWLELQERALIQTLGANGQGLLDLRTYNRLLGGQAGVRVAHTWGLFGLEGTGKAGLYFNEATSATGISDVGLANNATRNANGQNEAFLGEIQIMATIRTLSSWQYRIGYNAMWITQTALAVDQITNTANTGLALNARSDLFFHGPFAGAEFRW